MVSIIGIFGPVKVEIMGAGTEFGAVITDIGRLFQTLTFSGRKKGTVQGAAFAAALRTKGRTVRIPAEKLDLAGFRMFTFGTFSSGRAGIMRDQTSVLTDFSGNSGRGNGSVPGP